MPPAALKPCKLHLVLLYLLTCLLVITSCSRQPPIRIGFSGELSGIHADLGVNGRNGAILAVEMTNQSGGVAGRQLELIIKDDLGTSEGARQADLELIQAEVVAIIGHMTSSQTLAGLEVTGPSGILLFSPTTSTPALTGLDDNFLRLHPTNLDLSRALANHIYTTCGLLSVAVLYDEDNAAYSLTYAQGFLQVYRALGGQVSNEIGFSSQEYEPGWLVSAALEGAPQGMLIVAAAPDTALIAQHIRLVDRNIRLFTTAWAQTETLVKNGGTAVEGIEMVQAYDASYASPASQDFLSRYHERFGSYPNFAAGMAFETAQMLIAALTRDGGEPAGLRQTLLDTHDFMGLDGEISMDPYGDVIRSLYLSSLKNGLFVNDGIPPGESP